MKNIYYIVLLFILVACEDKNQVTHEYSRPYTVSKEYPIQLDVRDILVDIQVKSPVNPNTTFKIVVTDKYIFVGEMMKGVHVYEKADEFHTIPLCFIECKCIKAFDVADNMLYCNNFVDLLVVDVADPLQSKIIHRAKNYFNNYMSNSSFNFQVLYNSSIFDIVYVLGYEQVVLAGITTETEMIPIPDFTEFDVRYGNMIVTGIDNIYQTDKPYVGIINVEGNIFTLGDSSLNQCSYVSDWLNIKRSAIAIPDYLSVMPTNNLQYKDGMIFIIGENGRGFISMDYHNQKQDYQWGYRKLLDVVSLQKPANSFAQLTQYDYYQGWTYNIVIAKDGAFLQEVLEQTTAYNMINVNDTLLVLGSSQLTLHRTNFSAISWDLVKIEQVKKYPAISGTSMLKDGNKLIVANRQGLLFYDISDLDNIMLIR